MSTIIEEMRQNLDRAVKRACELDVENNELAKHIQELSGKLTARRDISEKRLEVITTQTRTITNQSERIAALQDAHKAAKEWCASLKEAHARIVEQRSDLRERITKLLAEVKGAHSDADMWLGQVHQRDEVINSKNILIKQRDKRIAQGDEELRLLMCDIHPDGRARGYVGGAGYPPGQHGGGGYASSGAGGSIGTQHENDKLRHCQKVQVKTIIRQRKELEDHTKAVAYHERAMDAAREAAKTWSLREKSQIKTIKTLQEREQELMGRLAVNPWTKSKVEGLQHKNQEIGSKLGYYKMKTGDLRAAIKVSESIIKVLQRERNEAHVAQDRAEDQRNMWKRKYHATLVKPVRLPPLDFSDPMVGRNG